MHPSVMMDYTESQGKEVIYKYLLIKISYIGSILSIKCGVKANNLFPGISSAWDFNFCAQNFVKSLECQVSLLTTFLKFWGI